jgi:hypothetical protein
MYRNTVNKDNASADASNAKRMHGVEGEVPPKRPPERDRIESPRGARR